MVLVVFVAAVVLFLYLVNPPVGISFIKFLDFLTISTILIHLTTLKIETILKFLHFKQTNDQFQPKVNWFVQSLKQVLTGLVSKNPAYKK